MAETGLAAVDLVYLNAVVVRLTPSGSKLEQY